MQKRSLVSLLLCLVVAVTLSAQTPMPSDGRDADRAAIRAHIDKIFKAYIDGDCETIRATHSPNWIGFTSQSRSILHGLDAYMNGSARFCQDTQRTPNAQGGRPQSGLVDYKIIEIDYVFYGDVALVPYVAETWYHPTARYPGKLRSLDVYAKVNGEWNQVGSNIYPHPDFVRTLSEQQAQQLRQLSPEDKQSLLAAREAVWRAFFANDQVQMEKLIPQEALVIDGSSQGAIGKRADILEGAKYSAGHARLIRLEFPQTEMQVYGETAILYTTYFYELEDAGGKRTTEKGRGTEMFVHRGNTWVNTGWHLQPDK